MPTNDTTPATNDTTPATNDTTPAHELARQGLVYIADDGALAQWVRQASEVAQALDDQYKAEFFADPSRSEELTVIAVETGLEHLHRRC